MIRGTASRLLPGDRSNSYVLLGGLTWGFIVTTFESLSQPPLELSFFDYSTFYSRILLHYGVGGVLLTWLTLCAGTQDRRLPTWTTAAPIIAVSMAIALLIDWLSVTFVPFWRDNPMATMWQLSAVGAHMAWNFGVYGGLYVFAFCFLQNQTRTRERLRLAELARIDADIRMERAMTDDRSPVVAPDLLLRALSELAQRYDENQCRANALLDNLVRLLRAASGAIGGSRLNRDADLAIRLGQLRVELGLPAHEILTHHANIQPKEADHGHVGN